MISNKSPVFNQAAAQRVHFFGSLSNFNRRFLLYFVLAANTARNRQENINETCVREMLSFPLHAAVGKLSAVRIRESAALSWEPIRGVRT